MAALSPNRRAILQASRLWLGTPFQHQASLRGVGCDCLGLVRGVYRDVFGFEPETPPAYVADPLDRAGADLLAAAAARVLVARADPTTAEPGDVLLFRFQPQSPVRHVAILTGADEITHAFWGHAVCATRFSRFWRQRLAAAFAFPDQAVSADFSKEDTLWDR